MGITKFPKDSAIAVLVSLAIHGILFLGCFFIFARAVPVKMDRFIAVSLVLPERRVGERILPVAVKFKQKFSLPKGNEKTGPGSLKLTKKKGGEAGEKRTEPLLTSHRDGFAETPAVKEAGHHAPDISISALEDLTVQQYSEGDTAPLPGRGAYLSGKGEETESGQFISGDRNIASLGGKVSSLPLGPLGPTEATGRDAGATATPHYRQNPLPIYPLPARRRGYEGVVILIAEVLTDGSVGRLELKQSSGHEVLDISAREAVKGWKFSPARKMGAPVIMWVDVPVRFSLN